MEARRVTGNQKIAQLAAVNSASQKEGEKKKRRMFEKELKNYSINFDNDAERVTSLSKFAKDAISFIMKKGLYPEFLMYRTKTE